MKLNGELGEGDEGFDKGTTGYFLVLESRSSDLPELTAGLVLNNDTQAPPWLVVNHDLQTMIVPNWPIILWKAQVLKPIEPRSHFGNYTRCSTIKLLERLPAYKVFGELDTSLCDILEFAGRMTLGQATSLSTLRSENAEKIHNLAWHRWLHHNPTLPTELDNYDGVLDIGGSRGGSPIGGALSLIHTVLFGQAGSVNPENAYAYKADGTPYLASPWSEARSALSDAALTLSESVSLDDTDLEIMRRPLRQVCPSLVDLMEEKIR